MRTAPNTIVSKEIAAYSINDEDESRPTVYNPEHKGSRYFAKGLRFTGPNKDFDNSVYDTDFYKLDNVAMSAFNQPQDYHEAGINMHLNDGLAHISSWYEDLPLNNDLPALQAFAATTVLQEPRSYKKAMSTL
jgi:hypothetical protein